MGISPPALDGGGMVVIDFPLQLCAEARVPLLQGGLAVYAPDDV